MHATEEISEISKKGEDLKILHEIEAGLGITIPEVIVIRNGMSGFKLSHGQIKELSIISVKSQSALEKIFRLVHLEKLVLNDTEITSIPDSISKLINLTHLSLKQNSLTTIPSNLLELPKLANLNLSNNRIESFETQSGQLALLKTLEIENNKLTKVKFADNSAYLLESLFISNNRIIELNIEFLINLKYVSAQYNILTTIPSIRNLTRLNTLELDFNAIEEFNLDLENSRKLVNLSISYNKITDIDFTNEYLKKIDYFFFDGNPLDKESKKYLKQYTKVKGMNSSRFFL